MNARAHDEAALLLAHDVVLVFPAHVSRRSVAGEPPPAAAPNTRGERRGRPDGRERGRRRLAGRLVQRWAESGEVASEMPVRIDFTVAGGAITRLESSHCRLDSSAAASYGRRMTYIAMEELTWPEAQALRAQTDTVGLIPTGALEQHGPHLPLGTDSMVAEALRACGSREAACPGGGHADAAIPVSPITTWRSRAPSASRRTHSAAGSKRTSPDWSGSESRESPCSAGTVGTSRRG